jgi:hypothetical protein
VNELLISVNKEFHIVYKTEYFAFKGVVMEIRDDGRFKVKGDRLDLLGVDFNVPVEFSLAIGNDLGNASFQLDDKLKFKNHDKEDEEDD